MSTFTPQPSSALTDPEMDSVIHILLQHAQPEARQALMVHCPVAYLKLCGGHPTIKEEILRQVGKALGEVP